MTPITAGRVFPGFRLFVIFNDGSRKVVRVLKEATTLKGGWKMKVSHHGEIIWLRSNEIDIMVKA